MLAQNQFSCFLIGEGTLPIQCVELLLEQGHQIFGIISFDEEISNWAKEKGIPYIQPTDNLREFLSQKSFDYLFSIVNSSVLPKEILSLPRQCAINYHDAPLPRYAGANATSWALMHQEKSHGVTWHMMSELVDGGDILKQIPIYIAEGETALTLNGKCYEAAISSFAELIDELSSDKAVAVKQNLNERTYFPRSKRPSAGGLLEFNRCAYELDALVRALDFGPYPNPLGLAKLAIGGDFIVVSQLEILDEFSKFSPGTITGIEQDLLKVSTSSYDVALRQVLTLEGEALSIPDFVKQLKLQVGYRFKDIESELAQHIEEFDTSIAKHEPFWVERLARLQPITIPYAERTASHLKQKRFESVKMPVPDEVISFLEEQYRAWNPGDFLLAAFVGYLARIGGTDCFDIGLRNAKLAGITGFFAAYVPSHLEINLEQSFEGVLEAVREQVELTQQHKTYARDAVARHSELRSVPELVGQQIFPVVIERGKNLDDHQVTPGNELTFIISEDGKECYWLYNAEVLSGDSLARMQEQFLRFLQGIVTDPTQSIAYLSLLSEEELHKILVEWNDTQVDYPKDKCIHQLFEAQGERTPEAIAVVFKDKQLTYRELNRRANQLAHHLQALGVGPEVLVGIYIKRSLEMVVGLLGILKAGGAYLPLDLAYSKERIAFMLEDARVSVLLSQQRLFEGLPASKAKVVCLDSGWEAIDCESEENPVSEVAANNLAYVIYTSGSTGRPKGVAVPHRAINRLVVNTNYITLGADNRVGQVSNTSFDAATFEIWGALLNGARLVGIPREVTLLPHDFAAAIREQQISVMFLTTALFNLLANEVPWAFESLRTLLFGGEAANPSLARRVLNHGPPQRLLHVYGPTENTTFSSWYLVKDMPEGTGNLPIGRPISNTQLYVLDPDLQPVPVGVSGELYIGGDGLPRGYLNHPDLTKETFIPNPFDHPKSKIQSPKLYKTGDLVRYLPDGNIEFLGRLDNQVKIRGFRIELGEIEAAIAQQASVQQTVVIAREDNPGDKRLVAYIVSRPEQTLTTEELRHFLKQKLPDYMVPSVFVFLDALPLTLNGKIDRRALPAPDSSRPDLEATFIAPRTSVEQQIADIWTQLLKLEQIGIYDNFFALGGHSLLATQVISRLRQAFGIDLPLRILFEAPILSELSDRIETIRWASQQSQGPVSDTTGDYEEGRL
ncbi:MAG: amino acid adenylation domain-containing protein [Xenococcaceae cyanobacterium]